MIEWLNRHKKGIMTYTLWLIIPSFVLLYGYGQCSMPEMIPWVVKVNGERINQWELQDWERTIRDRLNRENPEADFEPDEIRSYALETAIYTALFRQKAREWGIDTTNAEVAASIRNIDAFRGANNQFNYNAYLNMLRFSGYTPEQFEAQQRESLTRTKVEAFLRQSAQRAATETQRRKARERIEAEIEYLSFAPSRFVDDVEVDEEGLLAFFEEKIEDYRVPEKRRIAYARFSPEFYYDDVELDDARMQRFFDRNREQYELPEQYTVEYLTYIPDVFLTQVDVSDDEIVSAYNANPDRYRTNEKARIRYAVQPLSALAQIQQVTEGAIAQYYEENEHLFEHEEQVKASHILFRLDENANEEEAEAVRERLLEIRQAILDGDYSFSEAAKQFSEDPSAEMNDGDLGWFGRGRMVPPFEEAAFMQPIDEIAEPVRTSFGYHLILVEDRREEGKQSLDDAREDILADMQRQAAVDDFTQLAASLDSLEEVAERFEILESDWIERGTENFPEDMQHLPRFEKMMISSAAFRTFPEANVRMAGNPGSENLYLLEVIERQDRRQMTLNEARERVMEDARREKASEAAEEFIEEDMRRIREESATLEEIAEARDLIIQTSSRFTRNHQFVPGFGSNPTMLINTVMGMQLGQTTGPIRTQTGQYIIRLLAKEEPRLPVLLEVRDQVEYDLVRNEAERMARADAISLDMEIFQNELSILEAAAQHDVEAASTEFFAEGESIPGLGFRRNLNRAAFELQRIGQISERPVEERTPGGDPSRQPVEAYFLIELLEIQESYLPSLDEARDEVTEDYRLVLAEDIAIAMAQETLESIKTALAAGQPVDASRAIDLAAFADGENVTYHDPVEVSGNGQVPGVGNAPSIAKTAISLEPGQVSDIVRHYRTRALPDNSRVRGPLASAYILQVLDKRTVEEEEDPADSFAVQIERFIAQQQGRLAASAWIEEVSAASNIEYNHNYFANYDDFIDGETDDLEEPAEGIASVE